MDSNVSTDISQLVDAMSQLSINVHQLRKYHLYFHGDNLIATQAIMWELLQLAAKAGLLDPSSQMIVSVVTDAPSGWTALRVQLQIKNIIFLQSIGKNLLKTSNVDFLLQSR